ncbi:hypothetical protein C8R44DRAFT_896219 [Mycena epipterygia]|nr:hypothetical protein C8R44DRAFT_896219 [Mycena epipterygia]
MAQKLIPLCKHQLSSAAHNRAPVRQHCPSRLSAAAYTRPHAALDAVLSPAPCSERDTRPISRDTLARTLAGPSHRAHRYASLCRSPCAVIHTVLPSSRSYARALLFSISSSHTQGLRSWETPLLLVPPCRLLVVCISVSATHATLICVSHPCAHRTNSARSFVPESVAGPWRSPHPGRDLASPARLGLDHAQRSTACFISWRFKTPRTHLSSQHSAYLPCPGAELRIRVKSSEEQCIEVLTQIRTLFDRRGATELQATAPLRLIDQRLAQCRDLVPELRRLLAYRGACSSAKAVQRFGPLLLQQTDVWGAPAVPREIAMPNCISANAKHRRLRSFNQGIPAHDARTHALLAFASTPHASQRHVAKPAFSVYAVPTHTSAQVVRRPASPEHTSAHRSSQSPIAWPSAPIGRLIFARAGFPQLTSYRSHIL